MEFKDIVKYSKEKVDEIGDNFEFRLREEKGNSREKAIVLFSKNRKRGNEDVLIDNIPRELHYLDFACRSIGKIKITFFADYWNDESYVTSIDILDLLFDNRNNLTFDFVEIWRLDDSSFRIPVIDFRSPRGFKNVLFFSLILFLDKKNEGKKIFDFLQRDLSFETANYDYKQFHNLILDFERGFEIITKVIL